MVQVELRMAHLVVALVPPRPGTLIFDCILENNSAHHSKNEKQSEMKNPIHCYLEPT